MFDKYQTAWYNTRTTEYRPSDSRSRPSRAHPTTASRFEPDIRISDLFPTVPPPSCHAGRRSVKVYPRAPCICRGANRKTNPISAPHPSPPLAEGQSKFIPARRGFIGEPNLGTAGVSPAFPPPGHTRNYPKRTQLSRRTTNPRTANHQLRTLLCETDPISGIAAILPAKPTPIYAKQTQFPHTKCPAAPYLCETNPIPAPVVIPSVGLRSDVSRRSTAETEAQRPKAEGSAKSPSPKAIPNKQTTPKPPLCETNPINRPPP